MTERKGTLSKEDKTYLFDLINSCLSCTGEDGLKDLVEKLKGLFYYEVALCSFGRPGSPATLHTYINVSYPLAWIDLYRSKRFDLIDPIVKEHRRAPGLQYWADTFNKYDYDERLLASAHGFGLNAGYSYGMRSRWRDATSLFSFAGRAMDRNPRTESILESFVPYAHQVLERITRPPLGGKARSSADLSTREIEILKWAKQGKSTWEISAILLLSHETVKWHMKNIFGKLGAVNKTHAVAIAFEQGILTIG